MSSLKKRSFSIAGHRTSVALEAEFWAVLDSEARSDGKSLAALVAAVDNARGERPLASALRVYALRAASSANETQSTSLPAALASRLRQL